MSTDEATDAVPPVGDEPDPGVDVADAEAGEPVPERARTAAERLFTDPTPGDQPMLPAIRKLFRGEEPALVGVGVASFLGGLCEATLLVLIASGKVLHLALQEIFDQFFPTLTPLYEDDAPILAPQLQQDIYLALAPLQTLSFAYYLDLFNPVGTDAPAGAASSRP